MHRPGEIRKMLAARGRLALLVAALGLALAWPAPAVLRAQAPPIEGIPPIDPSQLKNQMVQALVRLALDRPVNLALRSAAVATESGQLAQDLGAHLAAGQGPNGGPIPLGMDVEVAQIAAAAAQCAQQAQQNLKFTTQDLEVLKGVLGGELDIEGDPGPDRSFAVLQWLVGMVTQQKHRNEAIDACLQDSMFGLGRLRAYHSLYPA
jgi:hypothetical protein